MAAEAADPPSPPIKGPRVGVWLTNSPSPLYYDAGRIDQAVQQLAEAGFNTLYPNVWSRGATFHRSRYAPLEPALAAVAPDLDPICRLTRSAHRRGLQVIPWFEYGLMEPADSEVARNHPDWLLRRRDGSALYAMHGADLRSSPLKDLRVWLNPAHPQVQERFLGLIGEIVQRCGVDGIQLDDHFAWPVELGYDATTTALYKADTGQDPPADITDRFWMRWRRQRLTELLRMLRSRFTTADGARRTVISLSPGPFRFAYNHWLQDWELWALGDLIDDLVIQNYAYSLAGFAKDLDQPALVKARGWGMPVEIGILAGFGGRTTPMDVLAQKTALAVGRGHGVIYFYWEGLWGRYAGPEGGSYRRTAFQQLHQQLFSGASGGAASGRAVAGSGAPGSGVAGAILLPPLPTRPLRSSTLQSGPAMMRPLPPPPPPPPIPSGW
ncbi:MAG: family 10 glycosylhydrolase [Synechococcus sp. ELA057]